MEPDLLVTDCRCLVGCGLDLGRLLAVGRCLSPLGQRSQAPSRVTIRLQNLRYLYSHGSVRGVSGWLVAIDC